MADNKNFPSPPDITDHKTPNYKGNGAIYDSLRFSYDFDRDSTLSYSEEGGKDIEFDFEDYPNENVYEFKNEDKNQTMENSNVTRKLALFEKYRQNNEVEQNRKSSDIIESFDKIFNIKQQQDKQKSPTKYMFKKKGHNQLQQISPTTTQNTNININNNNKQVQKLPQIPQIKTQDKYQANKTIITADQSNNNNYNNNNTVTLNNISQSKSIETKIKQRQQAGMSGGSVRQSFDLFNQNYLNNQINININNDTSIVSDFIMSEKNDNKNDDTFMNNLSTTSIDLPITQINNQFGNQINIHGNILETNNHNKYNTNNITNTNINNNSNNNNNKFVLQNMPNNTADMFKKQKPIQIQKIDSLISNSSDSMKILPYGLGNSSVGSNKSINSPQNINITYSLPTPLQKQKQFQDPNLNKSATNTPKINNAPTSLRSFESLNINNDPNMLETHKIQKKTTIQLSNANNNISSLGNILLPNTPLSTSGNKIHIPNYLDNQLNVPSQKQLILKLASPLFEQQSRIAPFLRKIRKMNSIYPNFNHPSINLENQAKFCNLLATIFEEALNFLENMTKKIFQRVKQPRYFPMQFTSMEYFLNSRWEVERLQQWQQINTSMRPRSNFPKSQIDEEKIKKALVNYRQVIQYYKQRKLDLSNQQGIKSYFRIRQKFWNLQRNMRSISEDVYQIYPDTDYPQFFYDYLNVIKSPLPNKNDQSTIRFHQQVLNTVVINQQRNQPLSCSQIGQTVRAKLEREIKFLNPF